MKKSIVFMFSGQGTQYYHMGRSLYEGNKIFQEEMHRLDEIAHDLSGESILESIYDNKRQKSHVFNSVIHTHPALFILQYALSHVLIAKGIKPHFVLGTSMGEFISAALAGVMTIEGALSAVIRQAKDFERNCSPGGMLAILHNYKLYDKTPLLFENSELAGINFDSHFLVSGKTDNLDQIISFLQKKDINYMLLPVSYAFHSSFIDSAKRSYVAFLAGLSFKSPEIPFISCCNADFLKCIFPKYFWDIVRNPILFKKTFQNILNNESYIYVDLSPTGTLANFVSYNLVKESDSRIFPILTPFGNDERNFERLVNLFPKKFFPIASGESQNIEIGGKMKAFIFPGQGSQKQGMGGSLFDDFKEITAKADDILGYSIRELCLKNPKNRLGKTEYTQPALYVVNALTYLKIIGDTEKKPDFVAGHSLGEYNALFSSGIFDFETGLKLVTERGRLMAQANSGGMAAVIGIDEQKIENVFQETGLINIGIANYNSPQQIVISGSKDEVEKAEPFFKKAGARYIILNVSSAFHSQYMQDTKKDFSAFLDKFTFKDLCIPVISNVTALPYPKKDIKKLLRDQITSPVQWTKSILYLMGKGEVEFEEIGPGNVLKGLVGQIRKNVRGQGPGDREQGPGVRAQVSAATGQSSGSTALSLGSKGFRQKYGLKYAYVTGAMVCGIASKESVIAMGKAGMMGYFGTGGLDMNEIEKAITCIQAELGEKPYGMNFLHNYVNPADEEKLTDLFLKHNIKNIEAAAFMLMTPALVRFRLVGLSRSSDGGVICSNKVMGKLSRPEVAQAFLSPAPDRIVKKLLESGKITKEQAELSLKVPMADAICVEADSGGHTDMGVASALMPAMVQLRDRMMKEHGYAEQVYIGAAGGIGTPEAAAAAFILGADFILTGSINQCTIEAGTSDTVKDLLQQMNVQDTDYAPAGDMFELGAKVQVLKKGLFFPARANKLYSLYQHYDSIDDIDEKTKKQLQETYFKRSFDEIYEETKAFFLKRDPEQIEKAEKNPKHKMALIFRWYFGYSNNAALKGEKDDKVNFQVHTGPALGAYNQWVKGTDLEDWKNRHVDVIGKKLMENTAKLLNRRFVELNRN